MDADPRDLRIQQLEAENQALRQRLDELEPLEELVASLQQQVEELQRAAARQAAPFRRRDKNKKPPDQHKRPGRPKGHPPAFRPPPTQVDEDIEMRLDQCPDCGGPITDAQRREQYVEDTPPVRPYVTKLTTYVGTCRCCGEVRSTHPLQVSTARGKQTWEILTSLAATCHQREQDFVEWLTPRLAFATSTYGR